MKLSIRALTIVLGLISLPACAGDQPTDTDLKAAYCTGVVSSVLRPFEAQDAMSWANTLPQEKKLAFEKFVAENYELKRRLSNYLLPRLFRLDAFPVALAFKSGEDDLKSTGTEIATCMALCKPSVNHQCKRACDDASATTPTTTRVRKCNDVSWLPY